jgi:uncharacterized membrane protein
MTKTSITSKICQNGVVAAIYFVLTVACSGFSYGQIQFRIAELLVLLCFFRPDFVIGVTLGCFLANTQSTIQPWDMLLGTGATLVSSLLIAYASPRLAVAAIWPVVFNAVVVGAELTWIIELPDSFWISAAYVGAGEAAVMVVAYIIMMMLMRNRGFMNALAPRRHADVKW